MSVLVAGNVVWDILVRPADEIRFGGTVWVEEIGQQLGGNGANTSYALARLGAAARLIAWIGDDDFGVRARARLAEAGVDLSHLHTEPGATATTIALVKRDGARAFLHQPGASRTAFAGYSPPEDAFAACRHFHLANLFGVPALRQISPTLLAAAREAGLSTSLDTGWDSRGEWEKVVLPCLPFVDILFVNEEEAMRLGGAEALHSAGAQRVLLKLGARGCTILDPEGRREIPGFPVEAIDTTGAGDCFAAGYLAATLRGEAPEAAARFANAVGALVVQHIGAVTGVLDYPGTLRWMKDFRKI